MDETTCPARASRCAEHRPNPLDVCSYAGIPDSGRHHQVYRVAQDSLQRFLEPEVLLQRAKMAARFELHQEVYVAARRVEISPAADPKRSSRRTWNVLSSAINSG